MSQGETKGDRLDRAVRIFQFLARARQLTSRVTSDIRKLDSEDQPVIWLHELPDHEKVGDQTGPAAEGLAGTYEDDLLLVDKVLRLDPPACSPELEAWLDGPTDDPENQPELRDTRLNDLQRPGGGRPGGDANGSFEIDDLADHPEIAREYGSWIRQWRNWSERRLRDEPARQLYATLFGASRTLTQQPDEYEFVLGLGLLAWKTGDDTTIFRHLATAPLDLVADEQTGRLRVRLAMEHGLAFETEMMPTDAIPDGQRLNEIRASAREYEGRPTADPEVKPIVESVVHLIDADAHFRDDMRKPDRVSDVPIVTWAPAIILRKRGDRDIIRALNKIADDLQEMEEVPAGLMPLVDPDEQPDPGLAWEESDGAIRSVDDTVYLPLPVNERQLDVIRRVDQNAQTVVQGPPGTGKTHTAAALISHLLALGKRVLVTAQTDRALVEVRDKLPADIRNLAVSVIGASRDDLSQLESAARTISDRISDHDPKATERRQAELLAKFDELGRERAELRGRVTELRQLEVSQHDHLGYEGSLAAIATQVNDDSEAHDWIVDFASPPPGEEPPVGDEYALGWLSRLRDPVLKEARPEASGPLLAVEDLAPVDTFRSLVDKEASAKATLAELPEDAANPDAGPVSSLGRKARRDLAAKLTDVAARLDGYRAHPEAWVPPAADEISRGVTAPWESRQANLDELIDTVRATVTELGPVVSVVVERDPDDFVAMARAVLAYLRNGKQLKVGADGRPKIRRAIRGSEPLFDHVAVDGQPPTTIDALEIFLRYADAVRQLDALDRSWPAATVIPDEDTLAERLDWHRHQRELLDGLLDLASIIDDITATCRAKGIVVPTWSEPSSVRQLAAVVGRQEAVADFEKATRDVDALMALVQPFVDVGEPPPWAVELQEAVRGRDVGRYHELRERLEALHAAKVQLDWCGQIEDLLGGCAADLVAAVREEPDDPDWDRRLAGLEAAWRWASTAEWLDRVEAVDINAVTAEFDSVEKRIHEAVEELSSLRAWSHAVSTVTPSNRAQLINYVQLTKQFGKTGGREAARRKREIRNALDQCRTSVPVWIMPLHRVTQQIEMAPDSFDVVIIDEASQAGLDAVFLQYLAPKIVVIGDDRQVSPAAVGIDQTHFRDLAHQYLSDDPFRGSWAEPRRSLFDEAQMRYGGMITLIEHRRCVPEIIGFSNRIAYEPDGIRLLPVRQYGSDRLDPIVLHYLAHGHREGKAKVNRPEIDAVVAAIEKCVVDPAYDGKTFGVISLLGADQAKLIEAELLERLSPDEWARRDLRCGDPPSFQGSERDVVFLSMVEAPSEPGRRAMPKTTSLFVQRYNVAVSRARDQVQLFHSITLHDAPNPEDMQHQLLDYCYGVAERYANDAGGWMEPVSETVRDGQFDSLFEQRVFNRLIDHGYTVIPQYEVSGYRIDLVVQGGANQVAVECDGDHWHGPDRYTQDFARQCELERMGWTIHRIRESAFYLDTAGAMNELRDLLSSHNIFPSTMTEAEARRQQAMVVRPPEFEPPEWDDDAGEGEAGVAAEPDDGPASPPIGTGGAVEAEAPLAVDDDAPEATPRAEPAELGVPPDIEIEPVEVDEEDLELAKVEAELERKQAAPAAVPGARPELAEYRTWRRRPLPDLTIGREREVAEALVDIVRAEGPMVASFAYSVYADANEMKLDIAKRRMLNQAVRIAINEGALAQIEDSVIGQESKTLYPVGDSAVLLRERGPRGLYDIPRSELQTLIRQLERAGADAYEELRHLLDLPPLTSRGIDYLDEAARYEWREPGESGN